MKMKSIDKNIIIDVENLILPKVDLLNQYCFMLTKTMRLINNNLLFTKTFVHIQNIKRDTIKFDDKNENEVILQLIWKKFKELTNNINGNDNDISKGYNFIRSNKLALHFNCIFLKYNLLLQKNIFSQMKNKLNDNNKIKLIKSFNYSKIYVKNFENYTTFINFYQCTKKKFTDLPVISSKKINENIFEKINMDNKKEIFNIEKIMNKIDNEIKNSFFNPFNQDKKQNLICCILKNSLIKKELKNQKLEVDSFFRELYKMNNFNKKIKNHSVSMSPFYNSITNNNLNIFKKLYNILNDYNNGKNPLLLVGFKHVEYVNMINDINEKYESIDNKIKNILIFFMNLKKELYFHNQKIEPNKNYINNDYSFNIREQIMNHYSELIKNIKITFKKSNFYNNNNLKNGKHETKNFIMNHLEEISLFIKHMKDLKIKLLFIYTKLQYKSVLILQLINNILMTLKITKKIYLKIKNVANILKNLDDFILNTLLNNFQNYYKNYESNLTYYNRTKFNDRINIENFMEVYYNMTIFIKYFSTYRSKIDKLLHLNFKMNRNYFNLILNYPLIENKDVQKRYIFNLINEFIEKNDNFNCGNDDVHWFELRLKKYDNFIYEKTNNLIINYSNLLIFDPSIKRLINSYFSLFNLFSCMSNFEKYKYKSMQIYPHFTNTSIINNNNIKNNDDKNQKKIKKIIKIGSGNENDIKIEKNVYFKVVNLLKVDINEIFNIVLSIITLIKNINKNDYNLENNNDNFKEWNNNQFMIDLKYLIKLLLCDTNTTKEEIRTRNIYRINMNIIPLLFNLLIKIEINNLEKTYKNDIYIKDEDKKDSIEFNNREICETNKNKNILEHLFNIQKRITNNKENNALYEIDNNRIFNKNVNYQDYISYHSNYIEFKKAFKWIDLKSLNIDNYKKSDSINFCFKIPKFEQKFLKDDTKIKFYECENKKEIYKKLKNIIHDSSIIIVYIYIIELYCLYINDKIYNSKNESNKVFEVEFELISQNNKHQTFDTGDNNDTINKCNLNLKYEKKETKFMSSQNNNYKSVNIASSCSKNHMNEYNKNINYYSNKISKDKYFKLVNQFANYCDFIVYKKIDYFY
jgi:hypothetical protein